MHRQASAERECCVGRVAASLGRFRLGHEFDSRLQTVDRVAPDQFRRLVTSIACNLEWNQRRNDIARPDASQWLIGPDTLQLFQDTGTRPAVMDSDAVI